MFMDVTLTYTVVFEAQAVVRVTAVLHPARAEGRHSTEDNLVAVLKKLNERKKNTV